MKFFVMVGYLLAFSLGGMALETYEVITAPAYFALYGVIGMEGWHAVLRWVSS